MTEEREKALGCLRELRNRLKEDADLLLPINDENFLIRFVRGKKYNVDVAYQSVRKYYTFKAKNPNISSIVDPTCKPIRELLEANAVMKLKHNDPDGRAVISFNMSKWDVQKYNIYHLVATLVLVIEELLLFSVDAQINGVLLLGNMEDYSFSHLRQVSPAIMTYTFQVFQGCFPLRIKQTHLIKESYIIGAIMAVAKPFMPEKFKKRMVFHGHNLEKLHTLLPPEILPIELGGLLNEKEGYDEVFKQSIFQRGKYYKELTQYGYTKQDNTKKKRAA